MDVRWLTVLGIGVVCVGLVASGSGPMVLVLLAAAAAVALVRRSPAPAVRVERYPVVWELPYPCELVWAFLRPAESAMVMDPAIKRAYHVPGTPVGVGERQAFEDVDGTTMVVEVIDYEEGRRAVTSLVSPPPEIPTRVINLVEPLDGGCALTLELELDVPTGLEVHPYFEEAWRSSAHAQVERLRAALAAREADSERG